MQAMHTHAAAYATQVQTTRLAALRRCHLRHSRRRASSTWCAQWTAEEVADALAVSETLVRQLTLEGTLPCRRIGRLVRYATADIELFIADRENHNLR